jgi:hypothetical protein
MFAFEDGIGAVVINIDGIRGGMWSDTNIQYDSKNIPHNYAELITDYIIKYGFKQILEKSGDDIGLNIIKNLKNAYFLVRPYDKDTHKYYMRIGTNCTEYERKTARKTGFYLMGVCVLGKYNRIDWIQSYYNKTNTARDIIEYIEKYTNITYLIPTNIQLNAEYWYKFLNKKYKITSFEDFLKLLNKSCISFENYYYLALDVKGYSAIYSDCNSEEEMLIRLLYDY